MRWKIPLAHQNYNVSVKEIDKIISRVNWSEAEVPQFWYSRGKDGRNAAKHRETLGENPGTT